MIFCQSYNEPIFFTKTSLKTKDFSSSGLAPLCALKMHFLRKVSLWTKIVPRDPFQTPPKQKQKFTACENHKLTEKEKSDNKLKKLPKKKEWE